MKKQFAKYAHHYQTIEDGKFVEKINYFDVRVMATAEDYAMVRRSGCLPFVCSVKHLEMIETK